MQLNSTCLCYTLIQPPLNAIASRGVAAIGCAAGREGVEEACDVNAAAGCRLTCQQRAGDS